LLILKISGKRNLKKMSMKNTRRGVHGILLVPVIRQKTKKKLTTALFHIRPIKSPTPAVCMKGIQNRQESEIRYTHSNQIIHHSLFL